jgi:hypothetical protein
VEEGVMPFELTLDRERDLVRITFSADPLVRGEVMEALEAVVEEGRFVAPRRLWDLRESPLSLKNPEIKAIGEAAQAYDDGPSWTAVVVARDVDYGQARVFHAYRENELNETQVFRDVEEAVAWLLSRG